MDFVALKEGAARDIALAFGVPPVLVGLPGDATYANAREAGRALYRQTVLPIAERILAELSALLSDWMGEVALAVDSSRPMGTLQFLGTGVSAGFPAANPA